MTELYPLRFVPIAKERPWGGERWLLCGLEGNHSVVSTGFLMDNNINELIEIYMGDLVGDDVYRKFGDEFPLLVKILHIQDAISFQVHPSDQIAKERHNAYGKAEAWYILDAEPDAKIYIGFNRCMNSKEVVQRCIEQTLPEVMNEVTPCVGDCFYIPAGTVHAAGGGLTVAEIQQVSDVTYRVYDWGREYIKETAREMHLELALDAIHYDAFTFHEPQKMTDGVQELVATPWFNISKRICTKPMHLSNIFQESFRLLMCTKGAITIHANQTTPLAKGDVALIPAAVSDYTIAPIDTDAELLEAWIAMS